ncbi:ATP-binding cassette domain-containing protein [Candidatus Bathyarchaeota archaeon]|nr:ATP-binding cassette domain-containing protein [Candidatus Bathyarchaeota archaeon]MBL7167792.1 ATP-binding cassette domain-containing protein [Candidatus Bathyarchaeota archaeon]
MGIIEVRDLRYSYPNATSPALKGIDLTIDKGEFILLTGPSGCGKTTFCRTLNGLIPHFYNGDMEGEVTVTGLNIREHPTYKLAQHVGLIFQNPDNQIFALTVEKDVAFGLENQGVPKDKMLEAIGWALETAGIDHLKDRATHEMSGGEKQRLAIASILAMKPKVLVLDEPTSFLDPLGAERIFRVLDTLNKEYEMTILLIEHRVDLATQYVDRVIIFSDGRITNQGSPEEVFTDGATRLAGVGIPRVIELNDRLKSKGILLDRTPLNPTMLVEQLRGHIKRGNANRKAVDPDLDLFTGEQWVNPIIEVEGVSFSYPSVDKALDDVSLTIHKGEFVAIMGENGAGKTTLVKHLNGLLRPQEGRIKIDGADIADLSVANLARKVGLVFQNPDDQLFSENVEEEISFALRNFGFASDVIDKRVDWALNLLDLERYRKSSPFILSGGERKRVALGSVLAWDPEIVVLDEPTIGQDYAQKERLRHFLMQLRTQGKTIIIVTHDVEFVAECKPRIVLMADGKIIADGPIKKVMTDRDAMARASVAPPEITKVFQQLSELGLPDNVLDVDEAVDVLSQVLEVSK